MFKPVTGLLLGLLIALPVSAAEPATPPAEAQKTPEQQLVEFRDQLQALETEVVSKSISLTSDEATKFWPVFKKYQAEQASIVDGQIKAVGEFADDYVDMSDEDAMKYVQALLDRDQRVHDLRVKYLAEYAKVIDPGKAARVIHISRRLGLAAQARLASSLPLVR